MSNRIFISYKRQDAALARLLRDELSKDSFTVWWDEDIQMGQRWNREIDQALSQAHAVLVLWSQKSVKSPWVMQEAALAKQRNVLISTSIDGTDPPAPFEDIQCGSLELTGDKQQEDLKYLKESIKLLISRNKLQRIRSILTSSGLAVASLLLVTMTVIKIFQYYSPNADKLIPEWAINRDSMRFFVNSTEMQKTTVRKGKYLTFVCQNTSKDRADSFEPTLKRNLIFYARVSPRNSKGFNYRIQYPVEYQVSLGDWIRCKVGVTNSDALADDIPLEAMKDQIYASKEVQLSMEQLQEDYEIINFGDRGGRACVCEVIKSLDGTSSPG